MKLAEAKPLVGQRVVVLYERDGSRFASGGAGNLLLKRAGRDGLVLADKHGAERRPIPLKSILSLDAMKEPTR